MCRLKSMPVRSLSLLTRPFRRRVGERPADWLGEEVHEHVVAVEIAILLKEVLAVEAHEAGRERDRDPGSGTWYRHG